MSDITLSASVRQNLLSLQSTTQLIGRTQNRLSTGLRVASPIDDPVSFFQAKGLTDRATDFNEKKDNIDQGVSSLTAATDAVTAIESLVQQLKGLATNAKSSTTTTQINNIVSQFNDLRGQIDNLANDASYQGLNLVAGTGSTLTVNFSNDTASILNVQSVDIRAANTGLDIAQLSAYSGGGIPLNVAYLSAGAVTAGGSATVTIGGQSASTLTVGDTFTLSYGTQTFTITVTSSATGSAANLLSAGTYSVGDTITFTAVSATTTTTTKLLNLGASSVTVTATLAKRAIGVGFATELSSRITNLDSALTTLRSRSQTLGSNVALLQTRLDFTKNYVNTLTSGSGKLTLADLNQEGGNLLALQTRQQLGIQALSFAGKSEQAILGLFR
ncbi:flagellin [Varunaivibrio sulfuroxidans]|uniref:Flagellin n=1 Tax=Varunaivibrio sulfuroxidans TaxID=1773489 RepID=A0A4R3JBI3_9PROT|nr:flagellin [Varunaivibrio sulfuroxidans]TCS62987.1 flagellin-like hook-associated protein FlgL [Varunaivibrio sulfuroxidans]WES31935.1 flagellin [Varunaivibrio sulfuroxidans]